MPIKCNYKHTFVMLKRDTRADLFREANFSHPDSKESCISAFLHLVHFKQSIIMLHKHEPDFRVKIHPYTA